MGSIWEKIEEFFKIVFRQPSRKERPKISLLIPFHSNDAQRKRTFKWLLKYWKHELPDAEIVVGHSRSRPFSKTEALNNAARKASGRVLVILDADAYMPGKIIERCADRIIEELDNHLWYVPYRHLWRLNKEISKKIITSDPENPLRLSSPPHPLKRSSKHPRTSSASLGNIIIMAPYL